MGGYEESPLKHIASSHIRQATDICSTLKGVITEARTKYTRGTILQRKERSETLVLCLTRSGFCRWSSKGRVFQAEGPVYILISLKMTFLALL